MKKAKMLMLILTSSALALTPVAASAAEEVSSQTTSTVTDAPTVTPTPVPQKKGWITLKSGKKKYFRDGRNVTGFQKIGKYYYYFSAKGTLLKNKTIKKGYKGFTYFIDSKGRVMGRQKGSVYYTASGKKMNQAQIADLRSKQIVAEITNSRMSKPAKLQTCFNWVIKGYYNIWRRFDQGGKNWPAAFANDHFLYRKGDCISDAAAFGYLAKAIGYKNVYVCADAVRSNNNAHSWTEINGLVYDPLFAEAKSYSKYYGCTYGSYGLSAILKYKLS